MLMQRQTWGPEPRRALKITAARNRRQKSGRETLRDRLKLFRVAVSAPAPSKTP